MNLATTIAFNCRSCGKRLVLDGKTREWLFKLNGTFDEYCPACRKQLFTVRVLVEVTFR